MVQKELIANVAVMGRRLRKAAGYNPWPVRIVAAVTCMSGLLAIAEVLWSRLSMRVELLLPVDYDYFGRLFGLFAGVMLVYFSSRLLLRKRLAWWIAFVMTGAVVVDHGLFSRSITSMIVPVASLLLLAIYQEEFQAASEPSNIRQGLGLLMISLAVALIYGAVGFVRLMPRDFAPAHKLSLNEAVVRTVREYTLIGNDDLHPRTRQAKWFIDSLDWLGAISMGLVFYSLFRPLRYRYVTLPQERRRAGALLDRYGRSSEDALKLWPEDKAYFFSTDGKGFLAYRVEAGVAVVLGEPVGPVEIWPGLLVAFRDYCHLRDWHVSLLHVPKDRLTVFEQTGWRALKLGEDAVVNLDTFTRETVRGKHFRAVRNKFERLGYQFVVSEAPHQYGLMMALDEVERSWLSVEGRKERGFGLGYYDHAYLERTRLYLAYDEAGQLIAFANGIRSYNQKQATVDLMRHQHGGETGTMDWLFMKIMEHLRDEGWQEFNLGLAPLAGVGEGAERTVEEAALGYLSRLGLGGFSFTGLRRFKSKFEPEWREVYLLYERGASGLARTGLGIGRLMR